MPFLNEPNELNSNRTMSRRQRHGKSLSDQRLPAHLRNNNGKVGSGACRTWQELQFPARAAGGILGFFEKCGTTANLAATDPVRRARRGCSLFHLQATMLSVTAVSVAPLFPRRTETA